MRITLPLLACALLSSSAAAAQLVLPEFPIETHELANGLRLVLVPDHAAPTVGIAVYYDVGSRNEEPGRSGFAHLFEHMMFQGSENVGKGEHFMRIAQNGGEMNGTTSEDRTNYFEVLPADRLDLGLFLEADRMRSLDISAENFENQREVVKEERRLRIDNVPYGPAWLRFAEVLYDDWEYDHSTIGSMEDLDAAELADVQAFFDLYYAPNNAVLVLAGDFVSADALALVEHHFGDIAGREAPPEVVIEEQFPRTEARVESIDDALATQDAVMVGFMTPPWPDPAADACELVARMLATGESSRLYSRMVRTDGSAVDVSAWLEGKRGPDALTVWATSNGASADELRAAILEEIGRMRTEGFTDEELEAAKRQYTREFITRIESNYSRAIIAGQLALYWDDPSLLNTLVPRIASVTREQVEAALNTYLTEPNSSSLLIRAAGAAPVEAR